jgi:hypothetical protein
MSPITHCNMRESSKSDQKEQGQQKGGVRARGHTRDKGGLESFSVGRLQCWNETCRGCLGIICICWILLRIRRDPMMMSVLHTAREAVHVAQVFPQPFVSD